MCRYFKKASLDYKHSLSQILLFVCCPQHDIKLSKMDQFALSVMFNDRLALSSLLPPPPTYSPFVKRVGSEYVGGC